jgi:hypothetical protein
MRNYVSNNMMHDWNLGDPRGRESTSEFRNRINSFKARCTQEVKMCETSSMEGKRWVMRGVGQETGGAKEGKCLGQHGMMSGVKNLRHPSSRGSLLSLPSFLLLHSHILLFFASCM